jgi:hypothetical protein
MVSNFATSCRHNLLTDIERLTNAYSIAFSSASLNVVLVQDAITQISICIASSVKVAKGVCVPRRPRGGTCDVFIVRVGKEALSGVL